MLFPEGAVIFYGGHTENGRELADCQVLCVKSWAWFSCSLVGGTQLMPTHGHSAALVERPGATYVVFVGGGTGSILDDPARCNELSVAQVVELPIMGRAGLGAYPLPTVHLMHESYVPGRHHTACRVSKDCVILYGGGDNPDPSVCVLDLAAVVDAAVEAAASAQTAASIQ